MKADTILCPSSVTLIFIRYYLQTKEVMLTAVLSVSKVAMVAVALISTLCMFAYLEEPFSLIMFDDNY